jgi:hypothetical protein
MLSSALVYPYFPNTFLVVLRTLLAVTLMRFCRRKCTLAYIHTIDIIFTKTPCFPLNILRIEKRFK